MKAIDDSYCPQCDSPLDEEELPDGKILYYCAGECGHFFIK